MTRSRAMARIRSARQEAGQNLNADRAAWYEARCEIAQAVGHAFAAQQDEREHHRLTALDRTREQLRQFAAAHEASRIAQDRKRMDDMTALISAVNDMIARFVASGDERREELLVLSDSVQAFLQRCRASRDETNEELADRLSAFREKLSQDVYRACTDDFS